MQKKVLIVDDSCSCRASLGKLFDSFGFAVTQSSSGAEGVGLFLEKPDFDMVVIDIEMPGMNGFSVARIIRQHQIAKRPLIVGVSANSVHGGKSVEAGMDLFVLKPLDAASMTAISAANVVSMAAHKGGCA